MPLKEDPQRALSGRCPLCEALIVPVELVEESEIMICPECRSLLVIDSIQADNLLLQQAPQIEEDWGE